MYEYCATILRVVDGDTVHADVDLGFDAHQLMTLRLAGINAPEHGTPEGDAAHRCAEGAHLRLRIPKPTLEEVKARYVAEGGRWSLVYSPQEKVDGEWRRRWRANVLLLKAKLEFIDAGDTTLERELLPYRVLKDGKTLEELVIGGGLAMLTAGNGQR